MENSIKEEKKNLSNMKGIIYFKDSEEKENEIQMIRLVSDTVSDKDTVIVYDYGSKTRQKMPASELKNWKALEPDGFFTTNIVTVTTTDGTEEKDVIVTINKILEMKYMHDMKPYAICRQSITDIFYNLLCSDESQMIAGLSVNRDNCPTNFDYLSLLACNNLEQCDCVNFYRVDTIDDILELINTQMYDATLRKMYIDHIKCEKRFFKENDDYDKGWCRNLKTLLKVNNFQSDINDMLGIIDVEFDLSKYLIKKNFNAPDGTEVEYDAINDDLRAWLSSVSKINIKDTAVVEYFFDIDLSEYNNNLYSFIRDTSKKLYFITFVPEGSYHESDLESSMNQVDFSTQFRLSYFNKYEESKITTN